jgi:LEA14-like dessication related protein
VSRHVVASVVLALALLTACAGQLAEKVEPPEVGLAGLAFGEPGLLEQQLRLDLRLRNPNAFAIDVTRVRFTLEVGGEHFADGWTVEPFRLPAGGETIVPVTVYVGTSHLIERIMALGVERRLDYRLHGKAELDNLLVSSVPFEREGELALPRLPGLTP